MGARQGEWELVGRSGDPVPGDPDAVLDEADHYADVAATIRSQAYRLRRMSESEDSLKGHYAEGLTDNMSDLANDLEKVYDRFDVTAEQLELLEPALTTARTKTKAALDRAVDDKESEATKAASDPDYESPVLMPWEKSPAEQACDTAMDEFNLVADSVASKIKAAADDDMKDSRWDKFKNFVSKIADVLTAIRNLIGVALLVLAVVALFVPGLNVLILGLMLASLSISVLLAATDNGSWTDVAWDVAGLLTLGIGSGALKMAKMGRQAFLIRAAPGAGRAGSRSAFARTAWNGGKGFRGAISRLRPTVIKAQIGGFKNGFLATIGRTPSTMATGSAGSVKEVLRSGFNRDLVSHMRDIRGIRADFPSFNPTSVLPNIAAVANGTNFTLTGISGVTTILGTPTIPAGAGQ